MRYVTVKIAGLVTFLGLGILGTGANQAEAQLFGKRRLTVQETVETPTVVVTPPPVVVPPSRVKVKPRKVVIREKRGVIARVPAVVISPPAITRSKVVESTPIVEERAVQPSSRSGKSDILLEPALESPATQADPGIESRVIPMPR